MRLPPLNALRAFDAAARHMSFQLAAEELSVTPAALSYQIRHLEERLGVKLFHRLNRAVELTDHGVLIQPGIHDGFERFNEAMRRLSRARAGNVLTVSAGPAFTAKWLAPKLYHFIAANPEIDVRISANLGLVDLEHDDVDVAIRFGRGVYPGCRSTKLFDEYVTPLCSPKLLEGDVPLESPTDLAHHMFIHDDTHVGVFELANWPAWLSAAGVGEINPERHAVHFNVADHALDAAIAGAGVVLGREILAQSDIEAGRLVAPFELRVPADFSFYTVALETRVAEPAITAFCQWLEDERAGNRQPLAMGAAV